MSPWSLISISYVEKCRRSGIVNFLLFWQVSVNSTCLLLLVISLLVKTKSYAAPHLLQLARDVFIICCCFRNEFIFVHVSDGARKFVIHGANVDPSKVNPSTNPSIYGGGLFSKERLSLFLYIFPLFHCNQTIDLPSPPIFSSLPSFPSTFPPKQQTLR